MNATLLYLLGELGSQQGGEALLDIIRHVWHVVLERLEAVDVAAAARCGLHAGQVQGVLHSQPVQVVVGHLGLPQPPLHPCLYPNTYAIQTSMFMFTYNCLTPDFVFKDKPQLSRTMQYF